MSAEAITVLAIVAIATALFITEWIAFDVTAALMLGALVLAAGLDASVALSGFGNPATVTVAAMLVLSAGLERTGVLDTLADRIRRLAARSSRLANVALLATVGVTSAFVSNTAIVAIFIPVVVSMAPSVHKSPSKLLMPVSFVSILGGLGTLVGTSTTLLVSAVVADHGGAPLSMFEPLPLGAALFAVGLAYLSLVGGRLLPARRTADELTVSYAVGGFVSEVQLGAGFSRAGDAADVAALFGATTTDRRRLARSRRVRRRRASWKS